VIGVALLSLINIGSQVVLNIVLSLLLEAFFSSYLISLSLLLYRRLRGDILEPSNSDVDNDIQMQKLVWGPFRLKGWLGTANNIFAIVFCVVMAFFGCWPPANNPTPGEINYSIVVFAGVTLLSMVYYVGWARKTYRGPLTEVTMRKEDSS
jgi:choline transport protein